jgi:hypothetical protein
MMFLITSSLCGTTFGQGLAEASIPCFSSSAKLDVYNPTKTEQSIWQQTPGTTESAVEETAWNLKPGDTVQMPLKCIEGKNSVVFVQASSPKLQISVSDTGIDSAKPVRLGWGVSSDLVLPQGPEHLTLFIANPTATEQNVEIRNLTSEAIYKAVHLKSYETQKVIFRGTARALHIKAELRISAIAYDGVLHQLIGTLPTRSEFAATKMEPTTARFELTAQNGTSSFIVEMTDPDLISQARDSLADPSPTKFPKILIGHIELGSSNYNMDTHDQLKSPWSWHVGKVIRWADFASIDCDGNPTQVEKSPLWWINSKNSLICFWGYHLNREIKDPTK